MDETEELIRLCARALVAQMCDAPGFELHMTRNCVLGLTDEPLADFNMLTLGPDAEAFLTRSVAALGDAISTSAMGVFAQSRRAQSHHWGESGR
ncbi:MAG: hypothetical protein JWP50_994 [Phenylobacterium sp.]|nr:hypothetical protein [Phenylobacterium sp.]